MLKFSRSSQSSQSSQTPQTPHKSPMSPKAYDGYRVKLFKIMGNYNRLRVLELLMTQEAPLTVCQIADRLRIGQPTLSTHLRRMQENGFLTARQDGANMFYAIKDPNIERLLRAVV